MGTRREVSNPALIEWITKVSASVTWVASVCTGIDMALWLAGRIHGRDHARAVRQYIQYEPAPPYLADEPLPH
jgi:putative intracellular protease/amidase